MMIVGLSGGFDSTWRLDYNLSYDYFHDSAAVLLDGGAMVAAVEQERINRIKHTNRCAMPALRACIEAYGATIDDVDRFAFYATEQAADQVLYAFHTRMGVGPERVGIRALLQRLIEEEFGTVVDPARFHFADHHMCHALSAYVHSGFQDCLAVTIDGAGEGNASLVLDVHDYAFEQLRWVPDSNSLGYFYREVIRFLGYDMFEEYKVMGLAPYGDPARYREFFSNLYELLPDGEFVVHLGRIPTLHSILAPRQAGEPFTILHKDIAAALQEALEMLVFHLLRHFRETTGASRLCLSGGVAHNSSLNGKILLSGLFEEMFVHPASHDAGGALGAAMHAHRALCPDVRPTPLDHVFVGRDIGSQVLTRSSLERWEPLVTVKPLDDVCGTTAQLLADGKVVGWVQGRSEFGPRSLGNRSILADPRPAENTTRINQMIKKREGYRPFAPSVLEQHVGDFVEVPGHVAALSYMTYVVPVRKDKRALLGAVTHVDGSARVQTVTRPQNDRYYRLIEAFGARTGVPVLLNTSFNNNAEPIVDTVNEAVACFLTTALDFLVVGDCLISRVSGDDCAYEAMAVCLPETVVMQQLDACVARMQRERHFEIFVPGSKGPHQRISATAWRVLLDATPDRTIGDLADSAGLDAQARVAFVDELRDLWASRLVSIVPLRGEG